MSEPRVVPDGAVVITTRDMYVQLQDVSKSLANLTSVIDPALTTIRQDLIAMAAANLTTNNDTRKRGDDFEARLRALDKRGWLLALAVLAGSVGGSQLVPLVTG